MSKTAHHRRIAHVSTSTTRVPVGTAHTFRTKGTLGWLAAILATAAVAFTAGAVIADRWGDDKVELPGFAGTNPSVAESIAQHGNAFDATQSAFSAPVGRVETAQESIYAHDNAITAALGIPPARTNFVPSDFVTTTAAESIAYHGNAIDGALVLYPDRTVAAPAFEAGDVHGNAIDGAFAGSLTR